MIELTTKVQDQPRGTTAQWKSMNPAAALGRILHEQIVAGVLLQAGDAADQIYMVVSNVEIRVYGKAFDQPLADATNPALSESVDTLNLSVRAENCLRFGEINTLADLVNKTESDLLRVPHLGRTSLREIRKALAERGLSLKADGRTP